MLRFYFILIFYVDMLKIVKIKILKEGNWERGKIK